ncbi:amino acid ABC transporter substrate-binding protein (PAAT family) [Promicromonospora sp. AC04]|uniref:ABC transporter substrate-binding protein n=1 Tax=Promicromonospora sp. AC04 TaxID=2135723 RepID=UPI000D3CD4FD|nr:ABC transporter substrate-binding protein [Promicromonospora sp. AC04]PUB32165.1 amino acid ABC transporter substrate-binding protein (PAAT family) [Promicromonospora sp. AC04]
MPAIRRTPAVTALALAGALSLGACSAMVPTDQDAAAGGAAATEESAHAVDEELAASVPADVRDAGVIRMAINPSYPPFEVTQADGTLVGLDPDLAHAIGGVLDLDIEFVPTSFDAIIPALQADDVDMAMASIGDTLEREAVVDFATYYWNGTLVLVQDGNPTEVTPELACGARIGVVRGSLQQNTFLPAHTERCEEAGEEPPTSSAYQDVAQAILALQSNRIDGVMADAPPVLDAESKNDGFEAAGPLLRNPNPGGVAFPKDSELAEPVSGAIDVLIEDGTYADVLDRWGLGDIAIEQSEINGAIE